MTDYYTAADIDAASSDVMSLGVTTSTSNILDSHSPSHNNNISNEHSHSHEHDNDYREEDDDSHDQIFSQLIHAIYSNDLLNFQSALERARTHHPHPALLLNRVSPISGESPLAICSRQNQLHMAALLLQQGASLLSRTRFNTYNALDIACWHGNLPLVSLYLRYLLPAGGITPSSSTASSSTTTSPQAVAVAVANPSDHISEVLQLPEHFTSNSASSSNSPFSASHSLSSRSTHTPATFSAVSSLSQDPSLLSNSPAFPVLEADGSPPSLQSDPPHSSSLPSCISSRSSYSNTITIPDSTNSNSVISNTDIVGSGSVHGSHSSSRSLTIRSTATTAAAAFS